MAQYIDPEKLISRDKYLEALIPYKDKQIIKVVTGIRRCGKSTLLFNIFTDWLKKNGVKENQIILVDLELKENAHLCLEDALYSHISEKLLKDEKNYVIIDEVQNCTNFQRVVDSLYVKKGVDVYVTGSNSSILSGELATLIGGRSIEIKMHPLSFFEYVGARKKIDKENLSIERLYQQYALHGGFPFVLEFLGRDKQIGEYLEALYSTIFKKDIIDRHQIKDISMFEDVLRFVFDNIGNLLSPEKIKNTMVTDGRKISQPTVENYLGFMEEAFLCHKVNRYNIKGREYLKFSPKYYVADVGLRNYMLRYKGIDRGRVLENIIFLELLKRGYNVDVGKVGEVEIDFVAVRNGETKYIQVSESVVDKTTLERELLPLKSVKDFHERILLTLDYDINKSYDGIKHINALDFLMEE
jgi:predicted AAA+ superfamily ATPase